MKNGERVLFMEQWLYRLIICITMKEYGALERHLLFR